MKKQGKKTQELIELRQKYVARGIGSAFPAMVVDEAKGAVMKDLDGNEFIDFAGGIGVLNVGHRPEEVVKAVKKQMDKLIHTCFGVALYEPYIRLAEKLAEITPGDFPKKTFFANSGAEAVENAVKIARRYTKRKGIISFECAFHGRTHMTMSLTSKVKPYKYTYGPFAPDTYRIPSAYCYRCYFGLEYPSCGMHCLKNIERFFVTECSADQIAAIIIEPVQGEGGFIVPPPEFLPGLREICDKYNILLVADEVQTGFGRTGKMFACENYNVIPDIITTAKSLGAGLPISAVTGRAEVMDAPEPGELGTTYTGNPLSCVAGIEVIKIMKNSNLCERANEIGAIMTKRLKSIQDKYENIGDVRSLGAMVGMELVKDRKTKEPAGELTKQLIAECYKNGLIIINAGIYGNVIRCLAPLVISKEELNKGLDILENSIKTVFK